MMTCNLGNLFNPPICEWNHIQGSNKRPQTAETASISLRLNIVHNFFQRHRRPRRLYIYVEPPDECSNVLVETSQGSDNEIADC